MRYVPNIIPEKSKVLPDYFKGHIYKPTKKNPVRDILFWVIGVFFLIGALVSLKHPLMFLLFGLLGFILIPPGHRFLERKLKFRLTNKIKAIATSALFIGSMPLTSHYTEVDKQEAYQQKLADEKIAKEKAIADEKDRQRKDSLNFYLTKSGEFAKAHKIEDASKQLQFALAFANSSSDKEQIKKGEIDISAVKAKDLVKAGKYQIALAEINNLLNSDPSNTDLQISKALCFSRTGKIQEAVEELKPLIQSGNADAEKLHNQINPIRKRISYYVTRCWDGSTSSSKGSGACSHHGGVKNWNEPVYEEYRKYE